MCVCFNSQGIQQCQHQFRNERWNCTTKDDQNVFGATLERGESILKYIHIVVVVVVDSIDERRLHHKSRRQQQTALW